MIFLDLSNLLRYHLDWREMILNLIGTSWKISRCQTIQRKLSPSGVEESADQGSVITKYSKSIQWTLQILMESDAMGISVFNEPGTSFTVRPTCSAGWLYHWGQFVSLIDWRCTNPSHFLMGIANILLWNHCLVCLWGIKSPSNQRYIEGERTEKVPASAHDIQMWPLLRISEALSLAKSIKTGPIDLSGPDSLPKIWYNTSNYLLGLALFIYW